MDFFHLRQILKEFFWVVAIKYGVAYALWSSRGIMATGSPRGALAGLLRGVRRVAAFLTSLL